MMRSTMILANFGSVSGVGLRSAIKIDSPADLQAKRIHALLIDARDKCAHTDVYTSANEKKYGQFDQAYIEKITVDDFKQMLKLITTFKKRAEPDGTNPRYKTGRVGNNQDNQTDTWKYLRGGNLVSVITNQNGRVLTYNESSDKEKNVVKDVSKCMVDGINLKIKKKQEVGGLSQEYAEYQAHLFSQAQKKRDNAEALKIKNKNLKATYGGH